MTHAAFSLVVAADARNGIGRAGGLPWRLHADMAHFKRTTIGDPGPGRRNAVIMGRRTWESIPNKFRPLGDRINIIVTGRPASAFPPGVLLASDPESALGAAQALPGAAETFVIGGGQLYAQALSHSGCRRVHLTRVEGDFGCDTFLPALGREWRRLEQGERQIENGIGFRFEVWAR